jgi:hypothetical protein
VSPSPFNEANGPRASKVEEALVTEGDVMRTIISDSIQKDSNLSRAVERSTRQLEEQLGPSRDRVTAEWCLSEGPGLVELTVTDGMGTAAYRFTPKQLADPDYVEGRLIRLWGDVLQMRSHKELDELRQLVAQLEGD